MVTLADKDAQRIQKYLYKLLVSGTVSECEDEEIMGLIRKLTPCSEEDVAPFNPYPEDRW